MVFENYFIRAATNQDIADIRQVVFTILKDYGLRPDETGKDSDLHDLEKSYFLNDGFFGVTIERDTNEVVGTFGLASITADTCELRKMYLKKNFRGKGIGKFMLDAAINIAKEKNYRRIFLETISPLKEAISLYKKAGFTEITPAVINERVDKAFELDIT